MKLYSKDHAFFVTSGERELLRMESQKAEGLIAWYDVTDDGFVGLEVEDSMQFEDEFADMMARITMIGSA